MVELKPCQRHKTRPILIEVNKGFYSQKEYRCYQCDLEEQRNDDDRAEEARRNTWNNSLSKGV